MVVLARPHSPAISPEGVEGRAVLGMAGAGKGQGSKSLVPWSNTISFAPPPILKPVLRFPEKTLSSVLHVGKAGEAAEGGCGWK